jgi:hypothetical protein
MTMTAWTADELGKIAAADELRIASERGDGTLSSERTIWVVRSDDDLYVRSVRGSSSVWYRGTQVRHEGHIAAGGISRDVTFADPDSGVAEQLDAEYRAKYHRYAANIVDSVLTQQARSATIRLVPR